MAAADSAVKELEPGAGNYSIGQSCYLFIYLMPWELFQLLFAAIRLVKCIEKEIL